MKKVKFLLVLVFGFLIPITTFGQITATYNEVINKQKKGVIDIYITQNGEKFSVGDTITLGVAFRNEQFDFIMQNAGIELYSLPNTASNSRVVIKKIAIRSKSVIVHTTTAQGFVYSLRIDNFDAALLNGEIKTKLITSDQALAELKKWKDKLDLGLITEDEYKIKKQELSKYIK